LREVAATEDVAMWERLTSIYRSGDWGPLIIFHGAIVALIVFACLQLIAMRGRRLALRALAAVHKLAEEIATLEVRLDQLEQRLKDSLDAHAGEVEGRVSARVERELRQVRVHLKAIESTVHSVQTPHAAPVADDAAIAELLSEEEAQFEEWEKEAKELAEGDEGEDASPAGAAARREEATEYPAEMGRTEASAGREDAAGDLLAEDVDLPEIEDEEDSAEQ
jgi:type II secretory pathway component PulJ